MVMRLLSPLFFLMLLLVCSIRLGFMTTIADRTRSWRLHDRTVKARIAREAMAEVDPIQAAVSMHEVFDAYLGELQRSRRASYPDVLSAVDVWLRPALGDLHPSECTPRRVARLVSVLTEAGLASNTVRTRCSFVRSALTHALRVGLVPSLPLQSLRGVLPRKRPRAGFSAKREVISVDAFCRLVREPSIEMRERVFYVLLGGCGLRAGEGYELRVRDIDRAAPQLAALHVTRQWSRKLARVQPPKSGGARTIPMHPEVSRFVDEWIANGLPRLLGRAAGLDDLIIPEMSRPQTGHRLNDRTALERFRASLRRIGLETRRLHALRHSYFAALLDAGVSKDLVAQFTHPDPSESAVDAYAHYSWRALCVAAIRPEYKFS